MLCDRRTAQISNQRRWYATVYLLPFLGMSRGCRWFLITCNCTSVFRGLRVPHDQNLLLWTTRYSTDAHSQILVT